MNYPDAKNLPPGNSDCNANRANAIQFGRDYLNDDDQDFVKAMTIAILNGYLVYLGKDQLQLTQLGLLSIDNHLTQRKN